MKPLFITGTDTDIGKTFVSAGIVFALKKLGTNVGIMKPFACGNRQKNGFSSEDVSILSDAAGVNDHEELVNPFFFPIPASPYTAAKKLDIKINIEYVLNCYRKLNDQYDTLIIEGIGGIMTPILRDYTILDLIKNFNTNTIIVTSAKIGTINHTIMTCKMCEDLKIPVKGLIINNYDSSGYSIPQLEMDLSTLTNVPVLCSVPHMNNFNLKDIAVIIERKLDLLSLIN